MKIDQKELNSIIEKHRQWLKGEKGGEKAYFVKMDLTGMDFTDMDLTCVDFDGANLRGVNLTRANLTGADLNGVILDYAILENTILKDCKLWDCIGNGKQIKNIFTSRYTIIYTKEALQIGCKQFPIKQLWTITDIEIAVRFPCAFTWWKENKDMIRNAIKNNPAV